MNSPNWRDFKQESTSGTFFDKTYTGLCASKDNGKISVSIQFNNCGDEFLDERSVELDPVEAIQFAGEILRMVQKTVDPEVLALLGARMTLPDD